ncbi:hypothetical protein QMM12_19185 [Clostridioides difficile]|nr:hypothetical protein [Clostridioides difficile]MCZ8465404.1 hypothetical protein [Clostridioides difficile]MDI7814674.1 hypothetical protein [Clostridioides difficile]
MKLKRKIFAIFLSCFLVISSTINSFALAPALVAVAPEIIDVIATLAVASGVALTTKDDIYDVARLVYENTPDWDSFVDTFKRDVSISADNVVKVGNDFLDMCKFAFDTIFSDVPKSSTSISAVGSFVQGSTIDLKNYSAPFELSFTNFKIVCGSEGSSGSISIQIPYLDSSGFFICGDYYTNLSLLDKYYINSVKVQGYKTSLDITFYMLPTQSNPSGSKYRRTYTVEKPLSGVAYDLPYTPGSYDWDGQVSDKVNNGSLDVYVPGNAEDLVGVSSCDVFVGENNPPYDLPSGGVVTVPNVENPSLPIGDNIVIPGDSVVDPPIDPPVDPPITPSIPSVDINFSPLWESMQNIKNKFPFSLPWDIYSLFICFDVEPVAPKWELPILNNKVVLDFSNFDEWANIVKFFVYVSFFVSLIVISNKLKP